MDKKMTTKLHITTPNVKTVSLGGKEKKKASYIQLREGFGVDCLYEDCREGAKIYEPLLDAATANDSQFHIITAPTEEDGLRAVEYLAGIFAEQDGYLDEQLEDYESILNGTCTNPEEAELYFDPDDSYEDGEEPGYAENFDRIPIIKMNDALRQDSDNCNPDFWGMMSMQHMNNTKQERPWWRDCAEGDVCIVSNPGTDSIFRGVVLAEPEIKCLWQFKSNRHVYVLAVGTDIEEEDYSVTSAVIEYTAACYRIAGSDAQMSDYYKSLFTEQAKGHGFCFEKDLDVRNLSDKFAKIDPNHPCSRYEKIMDYLVFINAPKTLNISNFEKLGIGKMSDKTECSSSTGKLEHDLVGMHEVKHQVNNVINMLRYNRLREKHGIADKGFHNVHLFVGAPGTAKTTVAKKMTEIMRSEKLLKGDRFISITGTQLKGEYVGQTAPKVHALFQEYDAIFIDEAYSLTCGGHSGMDVYSQEALAQLAVELEDHATDKLVIFAGYGGTEVSEKNNLMKEFLQSNPGISSRINSTIFFNSYSPKEMVEIVHRLAKLSSLQLGKTADHEIEAYFSLRQHEEDFGNGREARVFLEKCQRFVAERVAGMDPDDVSESDLNSITAKDIRLAIEELKKEQVYRAGKERNGRIRIGYAV